MRTAFQGAVEAHQRFLQEFILNVPEHIPRRLVTPVGTKFILEGLKKSANEARKNGGPGVTHGKIFHDHAL